MGHIRSITGFILGLTLGSLCLPESVLAELGRAAVSWTAEACPPGRYTITAVATHLESGQSIERQTRMNFPRGEFRTEFGMVPAGQYTVRVEARRSDGVVFAASQQVRVGSERAERSMPGPRRPSGSGSVTGFARPRPAAHDSPASSATAASASAPATSPSRAGRAVRPADDGAQAPTIDAVMRRLRELAADGHGWRRADLLDLDEDARWDAVAVEFTDGAVVTWILPRG